MSILISPREARSLENPVFIDTRSITDFAAGHIPGAVSMRDVFTFVCMSTPEDLAAFRERFIALFAAAGLSGSETAVFYENALDDGNGQSCRGYFILLYLGYPRLHVLDGGITAWMAAGLPTSTEMSTPEPAIFPTGETPPVLVTRAEMLAAIADPGITIIDVRDSTEWLGQQSTPSGNDEALLPGRIPGAIWLEWKALIDSSRSPAQFRPADEILRICRAHGVQEGKPVYLYCYKGARAASSFVALREAGFADVRNYFSSWNEWARDPNAPIDRA